MAKKLLKRGNAIDVRVAFSHSLIETWVIIEEVGARERNECYLDTVELDKFLLYTKGPAFHKDGKSITVRFSFTKVEPHKRKLTKRGNFVMLTNKDDCMELNGREIDGGNHIASFCNKALLLFSKGRFPKKGKTWPVLITYEKVKK